MKKNLKIMAIFLSIILAIVLIILLNNKTFFKGYYKNIPIPKMSYYINSNTFNSIRSEKGINKTINKYLDSLENCNNKYYYDKKINKSIIKYNVTNHFWYNTITLDYELDNVCESENILSVDWYKNINPKDIKQTELIKCKNGSCLNKLVTIDFDKLINLVTKSERIKYKESLSFTYEDDNNYIGIYITDNKNNNQAIKLFQIEKQTLGIIFIDNNEVKKDAVYKIDANVNKTILSLIK